MKRPLYEWWGFVTVLLCDSALSNVVSYVPRIEAEVGFERTWNLPRQAERPLDTTIRNGVVYVDNRGRVIPHFYTTFTDSIEITRRSACDRIVEWRGFRETSSVSVEFVGS